MKKMDQEIAILINSMKSVKKVNKGGIDFYIGKLKGQKIVRLKRESAK